MAYYGSWKIDDALTFAVNTHDPSDGSASDADSAPSYRVYEDETATPILTGTMATLDSANTTGFYSEQITLSAANGFEKGKCYTIYISAAVSSTTGTTHHNFQVEAEVDANAVSDKTGYSLTQSFPTNFADLSITATTGRVDVASIEGTDATDQLQTAGETALETYGLDHLISAALPTGWGTDVIAGSVFDNLADDGTASFDRTTDSLQAIRDRGDSAWITGGGGGLTQAINVSPQIPFALDLGNTKTYRLGLLLVNSVDDLPSTAEITPGTIDIDRAQPGATSWTSVVSGAACSEAAGLVYYDEVFDSGTGYQEGDLIRVTFYSQSVTADSNTHEISDATEGRTFYTGIVTATLNVNVAQISGDSAAADNLELFFDGTGYNAANSTIGTCTTNTDMRGTDSALLAANAPTNFSDLSITATTGRVDVAAIGGTTQTANDIGADANTLVTRVPQTLNLTALGNIGIDWANVENPSTAVDLAGTDIQLCDTVTTNTDMRGTDSAFLAASAPTNFSDLAVTATTGQVTVGTNNDKSGYSISGTKTTLDAMNDITAASVWGVSLTELSADPGASPDASGAVLLPYMAIRNKRDTTASEDEIHNDAGTVLLSASISDDGTTFTKAKYS